ncbi:MAG TPA: hypothetical protein VNX88_15645 [Terriglobales bacterium]|jgi:hypothetical protein|nr:hypothetical protein [Terriglobales bacterium]
MSGEPQPTTSEQQQAPMNPEALEVSPGTAHERLEGWIPQLARENDIRQALEKAFDYRGDITITRKDGSKLEGYVFDRRTSTSLRNSFVRVIPAGAREKVSVPYSDIAALKFSDRDPAAGKSFEAWVKKYWEKRAAGEKNIQITPEVLE